MGEKILFLTQKMSLGFGVAVVVHNLSLAVQKLGIEVEVACLEKDDSLAGNYPVRKLEASAGDVDDLVTEIKADYVIAHSSPFFEILPELESRCQRWVWEHGDPTPELFPMDGAERKRIADRKRHSVYPLVDEVIAISGFIRSDIGWPKAKIIYNGCDHIDRMAPRPDSSNRLKVGTLVRLGVGEGFYKGGRLYLDFVRHLNQRCDNIDFYLMGRGIKQDALIFESEGVTVYLNATNEERAQYLADLDILVSMSLWEGFNLPLVEAAVSGTIPFALDTGAHPEVTPYVFSNVFEMVALVEFMAGKGRDSVGQASKRTMLHVQRKFSWEASARLLASMIE